MVLRRLAKIGAFVAPDLDAEDAAGAVAAARALGLERSDVVVRRYATGMMRLALGSEADADPPSESDLEAALERLADRYRIPERFDLTHVFVSQQRGQADDRAAALLASLRGTGGGPDAGAALGDAFPRSRDVHGSLEEISRLLGDEFTQTLDTEAVGRWQGPVSSAFGLHLVYLRARTPERMPSVDEVRARLGEEVLQERREVHLRERLRQLRAAYTLELPPLP